ncbi:MAG: hypothetical protein K2Q10_07440 [Rhodospirillales bacterium]|nr:hypothetical protein [Rhodospirillales bacterium]
MKALILLAFALLFAPAAQAAPNLHKMSVVFIGKYHQDQIKPELDKAMIRHGMAISEENYGLAGSALVSARRQTKVAEMVILACMNQAEPAAFEAAANACAAELKAQAGKPGK